MTKAAVTTYKYKKNYWRRRKYAFYKAIRNFHYAKLQVSNLVEYSGTKFNFLSNNDNNMKISDILASCPDYAQLRAFYVSMKVRAIAVQAIPCCNIQDFVGGTAIIALLADNENVDLPSCEDSDHSLILNPTQFTSMYWKTAYPWSGSDDTSETYGKIGLAKNANAAQGGMRWTIRFIFYVLYKTHS